ncbi:branched-chain amino acid aminotransferase [Actimicrobium sp. CCC2.4]|uniref:branched-chain amino acid aminotransferase n=1 Tax=Actimicrobium sp. CCC2.4 TaxID=3048606 RepID=UPI002AC9BD1C|nr:branched-chain amino acid aminotransferase [Actimicrobium sp. CCC2.4]MEB0137119.1 branched-chain amino acid aminotransferase [Actimicrobium sp. CCC2.4]WPX34131.1 branched-chain amino acid aminotransferase [Actimicrobium sp. CCC2.4]
MTNTEWLFTQETHPRLATTAEVTALLANPGFGRVFTDHMVTVRWNEAKGWHDAMVESRKPFLLDPACAALHYAQQIFEGMKAYRGADGDILMFRPLENAHRFQRSAARMAMTPVPDSLFLAAVEALVKIDKHWVPEGDGSLYLRPFMFGSETFLGVRPSLEYIFCVIASPVGPYFKNGDSAVTVWVSDEYTRAAPGGTGAAKCGGNYAASLLAQSQATANGCDQVVFLDAVEHRWVEELGGMNVFFCMADGTLVTPPLSGTILPGITRSSVIDLARREGMTVEERPYSFDQWCADIASGQLREVFACGTAAVIAGVGRIRHVGGELVIADGAVGPVTTRIRDLLTGIQRGRLEDTESWVHHLT